LIGSLVYGDSKGVRKRNQRRIYRYQFWYHSRTNFAKMTIIMVRNKIVFVGATKVEEHAKSNYGIPHQLEELTIEDATWKDDFFI
jgi:hypothetical protein